MFDPVTREGWPSRISVVAKYSPHALIYFQGMMDVCESCGQRFRRMSDKRICGVCYPRPPLVDAAESA